MVEAKLLRKKLKNGLIVDKWDLVTIIEKQQAEIEALKTDLLFFQKEKSKEELKLATRYFELTDEEIKSLIPTTDCYDYDLSQQDFVDFARAILRKAQEK